MTVTAIRPAPGRVPPHNLDAEESLLGTMLLNREAIGIGVEQVSAGDFYKPANGLVFNAISALYARGEPVDAVTVTEELRRAESLEEAGGTAELIALSANAPAISGATSYARIVADHAMLRRLILVADQLSALGYSVPRDVAAAIDEAESLVFDLADRKGRDTAKELREMMAEALDHVEALAGLDGTVTGIATGYEDLDQILGGLQPSNLVVIGARPSMGKTALALGIAQHAVKRGVRTLFCSLEMSHLELAQRVLCAEARVNATRFRSGKLTDTDWSRLAEAQVRMASAPLTVDDNAALTIMGIRAKARRMKAAGGLGLVVVDYLQLMTGRSSAESRQVEIAELSRSLKILARELDVPVVALSQLSRNLESRADKRPMLSDLRESGAIEQDADVVLFLYRDEVYNPDTTEGGTGEIIVAKHRNGPTGLARVAFIADYARFANLARV